MKLKKELSELQRLFYQRDMLTDKRFCSTHDSIEILIAKMKNIKIKIYQEKGHHLPHIHIDYGVASHTASYAIESGKRLSGNLPLKHDRDVISWLNTNRVKLLDVWNCLQRGELHKKLVEELNGNTL